MEKPKRNPLENYSFYLEEAERLQEILKPLGRILQTAIDTIKEIEQEIRDYSEVINSSQESGEKKERARKALQRLSGSGGDWEFFNEEIIKNLNTYKGILDKIYSLRKKDEEWEELFQNEKKVKALPKA